MTAPLLLCIESATKNCSVALFKGEECITVKEESSESYIHSEKLALFVEEVLAQADDSRKMLAAVVISAGPGSYTGLRIGTALAKGICFSLNIPLISVPSLSQLAHAAHFIDSSFNYYIPMLDARRMEVYCGVFNNELHQELDTSAKVIDINSFSEFSHKRIAIFGDGAEKCLELLEVKVELIDLECSARNMGKLALQKYSDKEFESLAYYEPFYLKEFIAGTPKKLL
ncbi:MAG: tRNA (adenosine(37)-N6)-threonylcarbamoyltransferase complex dimerization subunit type 1 TsaB [Flavobacteriales bacterium]